MTNGPALIIEEIQGFIEGLKREFPRLFPPPPLEKAVVRRIPYRGAQLEFRVVRERACKRSTLRETEEGLVLLRSENDDARPQEILREWYRERAGEAFARRVAHWSAAMGVRAGRIRIKDQRTLWGSCSRSGSLNFNWRLIMAPPEVLDYLVVHELCHLLEMNHSRRFWGRVASWCPDYQSRRRWLREHSRDLTGAIRRGPLRRSFPW